jgi:hypothetical protein
MDKQNNDFSPQQSLDLITEMISQAKGNLRGNSFYFLFWGWIIVAANIGMFTLTQMHFQYAFAVWIIVLPAWLVVFVYTARREKQSRVTTHLERVNATLWISFGIVAITISLVGRFIDYQINPLILLAASVATATSGSILRYRPLMIGGIIIFICGTVSFFVDRQWQPLIAALATSIGYIVPGYQLKYQG